MRVARVITVACLAVGGVVGVLAATGEARAGSCHARGKGLFVLPDPSCTPGATNPSVTPATIGQTICVSGWSSRVRPPESVTEPQKVRSLAVYGYYDGHALGNYEYDHLIPISLGGALDSSRNLWPEPDYAHVSPGSYYLNPKDKLELKLHDLVCGGQMSLRSAQRSIARNWVTAYRKWVGSTSGTPPAQPQPHSGAASCTVSASYNSTYRNYDVYVHSNQPDADATVTDTNGDTASYYTDSSGYADVYLYVHGSAAGQRVTATVGGATCSAGL
jgi:hypothetical protein